MSAWGSVWTLGTANPDRRFGTLSYSLGVEGNALIDVLLRNFERPVNMQCARLPDEVSPSPPHRYQAYCLKKRMLSSLALSVCGTQTFEYKGVLPQVQGQPGPQAVLPQDVWQQAGFQTKGPDELLHPEDRRERRVGGQLPAPARRRSTDVHRWLLHDHLTQVSWLRERPYPVRPDGYPKRSSAIRVATAQL